VQRCQLHTRRHGGAASTCQAQQQLAHGLPAHRETAGGRGARGRGRFRRW
jgi:hypothetical protein